MSVCPQQEHINNKLVRISPSHRYCWNIS
jgi:hypothetical protein